MSFFALSTPLNLSRKPWELIWRGVLNTLVDSSYLQSKLERVIVMAVFSLMIRKRYYHDRSIFYSTFLSLLHHLILVICQERLKLDLMSSFQSRVDKYLYTNINMICSINFFYLHFLMWHQLASNVNNEKLMTHMRNHIYRHMNACPMYSWLIQAIILSLKVSTRLQIAFPLI